LSWPGHMHRSWPEQVKVSLIWNDNCVYIFWIICMFYRFVKMIYWYNFHNSFSFKSKTGRRWIMSRILIVKHEWFRRYIRYDGVNTDWEIQDFAHFWDT
jgi:hypothetical protein